MKEIVPDLRMALLVRAVQQLSLARNMETVMRIVRTVARELTGADGATFVLKESDLCYYADEDAISPLWKGQKFPMSSCISGWAMMHRKSAVIEDIYEDERIPIDAYKPTFVKSLVMVPIRTMDPIGAIGNYWAKMHEPTVEEVSLLQSLADITAVTIENIQIYSELEKKLKERTEMITQLSDQNKQLEDFCSIISHNLRAPLSNLLLISNMIQQGESLDEKLILTEKIKPVVDYLNETFDQLVEATQTRMDYSIIRENINLNEAFERVKNLLALQIENAKAKISCDFRDFPVIQYPLRYIESILFNLLSNSLKYRSPLRPLKIHFRTMVEDGWVCLEASDNGLGLDMKKYGDKLFKLRKVFHEHKEAKGFGLFITKTQVETMGGKIRADSLPDKGTTFTIQLYKA